ncbi:hypothetical protein L1987_70617 [Smallanthus sonchifolius]|uniref:Uncharacterized protein n=1 Tax=Smallanthus sonchifolius TaxID=185202 RepID=A0ACB9ARR5_9ASTR|nr:hypothetical protein L1987_70617 [Smallanthus sonchifolius]
MAKGLKRDLQQEEAIDSSVHYSDAKPSPPSKKCKTSPAAASSATKKLDSSENQYRLIKPERNGRIVMNRSELEKEVIQAKCHYTKAIVDDIAFDLFDDAYVKAEEGQPYFIGRIVEMFETVDKELYFSAQWFFRAGDTVRFYLPRA